MLDYDGTLAPFHIRPEEAVPYPEVAALLREIVAGGGTRIVVVSGRPAGELPPLLAIEPLPEIWGSHGWERLMPDGRHVVEQPAADARTALERAAEALQAAMPAHARLERKLASIALHWRGLPDEDAAQLQTRARAIWEPIAADGSARAPLVRWRARAEGDRMQQAVRGEDRAVADRRKQRRRLPRRRHDG